LKPMTTSLVAELMMVSVIVMSILFVAGVTVMWQRVRRS